MSGYDDSPIIRDEKLALVKCHGMEDWYTIERAEHERIRRFDPVPGGAMLYLSARISDACVEGPAEHMLAVAKAIRARGSHHEKRCAVRVDGDHVEFWSPRNSLLPARLPLARADELADQIERELGGER